MKKNINKRDSWAVASWTIVGSIFIILFIIFCYIQLLDFGFNLEKLGQVGDASAIANTILSGGALIGVVVSIFLQRRDLSLQREDLSLQREEFEKQNKTLELQRFEETFFGLLSILMQIVKDLEYTEKGGDKVTGREVFKKVKNDIDADSVKHCDAIVQRIYKQDLFDHYFRYLYRIIKIIDEFEFSKVPLENHKKKYFYTSIIRSQLTSDEQFCIFYDGLGEYGKDHFKPLIEKYSLLDGIRDDKVKATSQWKQYAESAYEQSKYKFEEN